jgi:succinate dehydrogenase / fumarate reductase flavoprotein subunit
MPHATHSYDVLIIGAGGAGMRAAIEAAGAGVSVGLICKSLLGKAHTVMAEGGMAAAFAREHGQPRVDEAALASIEKGALEPFERGASGENPYKVQEDLQASMQALVGIVRLENEMQEALVRLDTYKERAARVGVSGSREYHAGWHTALDLRNLLTVSEAIALSAIERKESRGGHFREDYPDKVAEFGTINVMVKQVGDGMRVSRVPIAPMPDELKQVIEEQKS